jgi:hypothetical protein
MNQENKLPPEVQMMKHVLDFWAICCIYVAARLNLADHLYQHAMTAEELASKTDSHKGSLYRLLRALSEIEVVKENEAKQFELTPLGATLQTDAPGSMKAMIITQLGDHFSAWGNLRYSVKTGKIAFDFMHGMSIWDYYKRTPEDGLNFMKAMTGLTQVLAKDVLDAYDFSQFKTILDIGGGNGALLFAILEKAPGAKGIVFDEDYVVEETENIIRDKGLEDRCSVLAGSFFEKVPPDADSYLMKMILHDWSDEKALKILQLVSDAMKPTSLLLVFEAVIPEGNVPHPGKLMDINMLTMTGGKERTAKEFADLFYKAGLRLSKIISTPSPVISIIEVMKDYEIN